MSGVTDEAVIVALTAYLADNAAGAEREDAMRAALEAAANKITDTVRAEVRREVAEEIARVITEAGDKRSPDRHSENEEQRDHGSTRYAAYLDAASIARDLASPSRDTSKGDPNG